MDIGPAELLIVLAIVLLLFGSKKLPEMARGMGQAAKEFRNGMRDDSSDTTANMRDQDQTNG
jgi:sec-independent protein translocase protein TatA